MIEKLEFESPRHHSQEIINEDLKDKINEIITEINKSNYINRCDQATSNPNSSTLSELNEMSMKEEIKEHFPYEIYKTPNNVKEYIEKQKPLKVKIIKCSRKNWYENKIEEEFEVIECDNNFFEVVNNEFSGCGINKADCEIIKEEEQKNESCTGCQFEHSPIIFCADCSDYSMYEPIQKLKEKTSFLDEIRTLYDKWLKDDNMQALSFSQGNQICNAYEQAIQELQCQIVDESNEVAKLKRYNSNLLADKLRIQKANKNLRNQVNQLTDELDNKQIKIDGDIIDHIKRITDNYEALSDEEKIISINDVNIFKRLLQQLNKE